MASTLRCRCRCRSNSPLSVFICPEVLVQFLDVVTMIKYWGFMSVPPSVEWHHPILVLFRLSASPLICMVSHLHRSSSSAPAHGGQMLLLRIHRYLARELELGEWIQVSCRLINILFLSDSDKPVTTILASIHSPFCIMRVLSEGSFLVSIETNIDYTYGIHVLL